MRVSTIRQVPTLWISEMETTIYQGVKPKTTFVYQTVVTAA